MTRETKIGLLVGLAFIIVIGILLSDHVTSSTEPPPAPLSNAGGNVRNSVTAPGQGTSGAQNPPITRAPVVQPDQPVPTQTELAPRPQVVQVEVGGPTTPAQNPTRTTAQNNTAPSPQQNANANPAQPAVTQTPSGTLADTARQYGEPIIPNGAHPAQTTTASDDRAGKHYTAQSGDTLSHIALRQMGANTKANRDAIIRANPSLASNPDVIIAGRTYVIPGTIEPAPVARSTPQPAQAAPIVPDTTASRTPVATPTRTDTYVCKSGDNLWKIAEAQLGSGRLWTAIRDLNRQTLKGGDTVQPGMTLRLPPREVASVD